MFTTTQFHILPGDELPIYRQIMRQVTDALATGRLEAGAQLPSQRELAQELIISPLTVKKAYDELERQGLIETRRGKGTFVVSKPPRPDPAEQERQLRIAARRLVIQARIAGTPLTRIAELIKDVDQELAAHRASHRGGTEA